MCYQSKQCLLFTGGLLFTVFALHRYIAQVGGTEFIAHVFSAGALAKRLPAQQLPLGPTADGRRRHH